MTVFTALDRIGCQTPAEALLVLPKDYVDKTHMYRCINAHLPTNRLIMFCAVARSWRGLNSQGQVTYSPYPRCIDLMLDFEDTKGFRVRFFGLTPDAAKMLVDMPLEFQASIKDYTDGQRFLQNAQLAALSGKIEPQYAGVQGSVSGTKIEAAVRAALAMPDALDAAAQILMDNPTIARLLHQHSITARQLIVDLHRPSSFERADTALRLARHCVVQEVRALALQGSDASRSEVVPAFYNLDEDLRALVQAQPETLSHDQRHALNGIRKLVNAQRGVRILLNGDVGTGKTLVFLLALAAICQASLRRVAVVVPSDLVARQIHAQAVRRFPHLEPDLVIAGTTPSPHARMLIGTQALFTHAGELDLEALVVDEQHKFSVQQRTVLSQGHTHIIEASATPIPRSLALALFDGWQQIRLTNSPVSKTIRSSIASNAERSKVNQLIRTHMSNGRKIIFLYPKVSGQGASVKAAGERLGQHFKNKVAVLHGQMASEAKTQALQAFASGDKPIVVASTAVEVGVDVPDIGLMVVSGADRFGVAQLHQLRGRLARNGGSADFVMVLDKQPSRLTQERLQAVCDHPDGFSLAERDMEIRGFGDVLGEFQTGKSLGTFKLPRLEVQDFIQSKRHF
ncbi:helicase-related protein [Melaminivora jejuensis]|uniref:helicase-related protein n=1 Tax=Melaminivora jejuensis TaxID=1267217 RepID=UPI001ADF7C66|nr:helicase-related protein [Melaminivora jejuensis]UHJ63505.1 DEAD/DEAH box helicase [Melaminivora jejuensis]